MLHRFDTFGSEIFHMPRRKVNRSDIRWIEAMVTLLRRSLWHRIIFGRTFVSGASR